MIKKGLFRKTEETCGVCRGTGFTDIPDHFERLNRIKPRLFELKMSGQDISEITEHLIDAREAIKNNEHQRAKEIIDRVENELDNF